MPKVIEVKANTEGWFDCPLRHELNCCTALAGNRENKMNSCPKIVDDGDSFKNLFPDYCPLLKGNVVIKGGE